VSAHVPAHRWADLWAGRVAEAERVVMERHAQACHACARARQRVMRASDSFTAIRGAAAPDVPWDTVRARVHWSVSSERRSAHRARRPAYRWLAAGLASGVVIAVLSGPAVAPIPPSSPVASRAAPPARPVSPAPLLGLVSRASGEVMLDGVRRTDLFTRKLVQGSRIATGDGRVDVQFGDRSAFALAPRSTVELRRFDAELIELAVEGTIDVTLAARAAGQRFLVDAGDHVVEVRGTQFRVAHHASATMVACRHGLVAVSDRRGRVEVGAARRVQLVTGRPVAVERVVALSTDELAALAQATPLALPLWDPALAHNSAPLEIATAGRRDVRVDGVELGVAPLTVRVMPGRHTVEAADNAGRFRRAGWIDVGLVPNGARLDIPLEAPLTGGNTERHRQLRAGVDRPRLARCMRSIAKAGLTGTYVQVELAVDARGALGFLNVVDTDLPSATASCVREVLADVRFGIGPAASWRERIDL
jgi:hypothetical protein